MSAFVNDGWRMFNSHCYKFIQSKDYTTVGSQCYFVSLFAYYDLLLPYQFISRESNFMSAFLHKPK